MISAAFNGIYRIWLNYEDLQKVPLGSTDLKLVEVFKNKFKDGTVEKRKLVYLLNEKTKHLYCPFSEKFIEVYKKNDFSKCEFNAEKVYSFKCREIFIKNFPETFFCKIVKALICVGWNFIEALNNGEPPLAILSSLMLIPGQFMEVIRLIYYSIGIQIAALEGLLFDPIKGVFVIELMETLLNRTIDKKEDPIHKFSKNKLEIDDYLHHWYLDCTIIKNDNLDAKTLIYTPCLEEKQKFELLRQKDCKVSLKPNLFPLVNYITFKTITIALKIQKFAIDVIKGEYDFSNVKSRLGFQR